MKYALIPLMALLAAACGNNTNLENDSVEMAKEVNQRLDSAKEGNYRDLAYDRNFLIEAYSNSLTEIELGDHAARHAGNNAVKQYGRMLADQHRAADSSMTVMAQVKGIAIPNVPKNEHLERISKLKQKSGDEFDKEYMDWMIQSQRESIRQYEDAAQNINDPDIRAHAAYKLPILQQHLENARRIREGLK